MGSYEPMPIRQRCELDDFIDFVPMFTTLQSRMQKKIALASMPDMNERERDQVTRGTMAKQDMRNAIQMADPGMENPARKFKDNVAPHIDN